MGPEDLRNLLKEQPFRPFRIRLDDGRSFAITHPDMVHVGRRVAIILVFESGPERYFQRHVTISLLHISSIEPLTADSQAG